MFASSALIFCTCVVVSSVAQRRSNEEDLTPSSDSGSEFSSDATKEKGSGSDTVHYSRVSGSSPSDTYRPWARHSSGRKLATKVQMDGGSWPDTEPPVQGPTNPPAGSGSGNQPAPGSGTVPNNYPPNTSPPNNFPPSGGSYRPTGNGNQPVVYPSTQSVGAGPGNAPAESGSGNQPAPGSGSAPNNYPPTGGTGSENQQITYPPIKVTGNGNQPVVYPPTQTVGAGRPQTVLPCTAPCIQYAVSIRAERHRTILTIYEFTRLVVRPLAVTDVRDLLGEHKTFVTPGMFNPAILQTPTEIVRYLSPLIHVALNLVPSNYHTVTPLFFSVPSYLKSVDVERAYLVTKEANRFLDDKYQVPFIIPKKGFDTTKAASSWVTVNFLRGTFKKSTDDSGIEKFQQGEKKVKTVGIVDIDAQLRIIMAFDKKVVDSNVTDLIRAWDKVYALVADGSPGEFSSILLDYVTLVDNGSGAEAIESPCHHKNFQRKIRFQLVPKLLIGSGNREKCREFLIQIIPEFLSSQIKQYKGRLYTPYSTLEALQAIGCSKCDDGMKYITPALIVKAAEDFCESSGDEIYPCLQSSILIEGVTHRYGLKDNRRIRVLKSVSDIDWDWSLGATLVSIGLLEN